MNLRTLFPLLFLAVSACAGGAERTPVRTVEGPPRRLWTFPSRSELAAIAPAALRPEARRPDDLEGVGWQIDEASLPGAADAALLARRVGALGGEGQAFTPSLALACAARELSRFRLAKRASPGEGLRRHLLAHCGSTLTTASYGYAQGDSAAKIGDDAIWRDAIPKLREGLAAVAAGAEVGVAFVREGDRVVVSLLAGSPAIELAPSALPVKTGEAGEASEGRAAGGAGEARAVGEVGEADTSFVLRGVSRVPAEALLGLVNQGALGVARCWSLPGVAAPRFELRCPLAAGDRAAWAEIAVRAPNHPGFEIVARLAVRRPGLRPRYAPPAPVGDPVSARDEGEFVRGIVARVNEIRREGGVPPLAMAAGQGASNARLAGPLLNAELVGDRELGSRVAAGLAAGWDVEGVVREGQGGSFLSPPVADASAWLGEALERPFGRWLLFAPDRRALALGFARRPDALGAVVTTYALFDEAERGAEADRAVAALAARRAERRLGPPTRLEAFAPLRDGVQKFEAGGDARAALAGALAEATWRFGRAVYGTVLEVSDLRELVFPHQFFAPLPPHVAIDVGHRRAPGEAWGHYAVFVVVVPRQVRDDYRRPPPMKDEPAMPEDYAFPRVR